MTYEQNWAGNYRFAAAHIHCPDSIDAVRRLVAASPKIRAIGARHSFNGIADSPGDLVDLAAIPPDPVIDRERRTVTVGAGVSYSILAEWLQRQGHALHNLASLPHITVAGAIATGTHGSGDRNGTLASAVTALELVAGDGSLVRVARGHDDFDAMVVGLGAFGIVTRVTLEIQPSFDMRQDAFVSLPWDDLLARFDAISAAAYSVSILTKWSGETVDRLWLKTRLVEGRQAAAPAEGLGLLPGPAFVTPVEGDDPVTRLNPFGGVAGPWSERLAHFRPDVIPGALEQIQSEYLVSRPNLAKAVAALRGIGDRIDPYLRVTEIRTMAADAQWLSPAYLQDTVGLHFTWLKEPEPVDALTREI